MVTLTIAIPDAAAEDVIKYLKEKNVIINAGHIKTLNELTVDDYRKNFLDRTKTMRTPR